MKMPEKSELVLKHSIRPSGSLKDSAQTRRIPGISMKPVFKTIPLLEQVKIVTRLIEYFETR
jgi:hypothetical protein